MLSLLEVVDKYIFSGVPSNAAWDLIKRVWERVTGHNWETLFLDAFEETVENEHPRLAKYAGQDAEISINRTELRAALHYDLGAPIPLMTLENLTDEEFGDAVAGVLVSREAVIIGGHLLNEEDYASIVTDLVRKSIATFRRTVLTQQDTVQQAILDQTVGNARLTKQTLEYLQDHFSLVHSKLDEHSALLQEVLGRIKVIEEKTLNQIGYQHYKITLPIPTPDSRPLAPDGYIQRSSLIQAMLVSCQQ